MNYSQKQYNVKKVSNIILIWYCYKTFMFVTLILHLYGTRVIMMENHVPLLWSLSSRVYALPTILNIV